MPVTPTSIVAYLTLFFSAGILFIFIALLLGRFLRPHVPSPQKAETYECGETAVGPSFLQYDLRFYVVALLFIIFEVEVALFFPPAVVFGKVNALRSHIPEHRDTVAAVQTYSPKVSYPLEAPPPAFQKTLEDLGVPESSACRVPALPVFTHPLKKLALAVIVDLGLFFAILLVGFAYLWHRGDIAWVRAGVEKKRMGG